MKFETTWRRRTEFGDNVARYSNARTIQLEGSKDVSIWHGLSVRERSNARPSELRAYYLRNASGRRTLRNFVRAACERKPERFPLAMLRFK